MNKKFCIVIPIYKEHPDPIEVLSLFRLNSIIGNKGYNVFFITHKDLNIDDYLHFYQNVKIEYFDKYFFQNTSTYSQLCFNYDFYNRFSEFDQLFIYQTDCYLVYDDFQNFANLDYDYIGSPIFSTDCGWPTLITDENGNEIYKPVVGNGGFSSRKIETFKYLTEPNGNFWKHAGLTDEIIKTLQYEDLFICVELPKYFELNVCPLNEAFKFGWDMSVDVIYNFWKIKEFPMCIHAWDKNIRFWKNHFPELQELPQIINYCENKHKEFFKVYYNENNETIR
jgi:hypothetical protein